MEVVFKLAKWTLGIAAGVIAVAALGPALYWFAAIGWLVLTGGRFE